MLDENSAAYRWHKMAQQRKPTEEKQAFELALSQSLNALAQVEHFTDQEPYLLEFLASCYANNFWRIHRSYKDTIPGHFACRVRNRNNAFEAAWHHNWYMSENQMAQRHNKKYRVRSTHIRKGKGFRYPKGRFSKANKEWESDLIDYTEDGFALVREIRHEILAIKKKAQTCTKRLHKLHKHFKKMEVLHD